MNTDDARDLYALVDLYGDLIATACGESATGSPMTAARLAAAAVTVSAEIRARLNLPDPDHADPRDVPNLSALVDSTAGCPTADRCAGCGTRDELSPTLGTTPYGIRCLTLCQQCDANFVNVPPPADRDAAYALVIWHAGHIGLQVTHLNGRHPGCPACGRLHQTWCPPYGGPGYSRAAATAEHDGLRWHLFTRHANLAALTMSDADALDDHAHEHRGPGTIRNHPAEDLTYQPELAAVMLDESTHQGYSIPADVPPAVAAALVDMATRPPSRVDIPPVPAGPDRHA
ncbi:hypothetical protein [Micromonospora sp. RP3T]|uniref:hypothetical protein n=1 Tax=Micromonospora sp. RP3T TaxID=2135446 RepID=UPI003D7028A5